MQPAARFALRSMRFRLIAHRRRQRAVGEFEVMVSDVVAGHAAAVRGRG